MTVSSQELQFFDTDPLMKNRITQILEFCSATELSVSASQHSRHHVLPLPEAVN